MSKTPRLELDRCFLYVGMDPVERREIPEPGTYDCGTFIDLQSAPDGVEFQSLCGLEIPPDISVFSDLIPLDAETF